MPAAFHPPTVDHPLTRGSVGGYQTRRPQGRSFLARSLFRLGGSPGLAVLEPRGRGTARVDGESKAHWLAPSFQSERNEGIAETWKLENCGAPEFIGVACVAA